jgi:hypothetical protein
MASWAIGVSTYGVILLNLALIGVRSFASRHGLKIRWWSPSYSAERQYLRELAQSADPLVAQKAKRYLRLEIAVWCLFFPLAALFFWGVASR